MNPLRRKAAADTPESAEDATLLTEVGGGKGRPTPKRRTRSAPPVPAPRTRKEAAAWQKRQRKTTGANRGNLTGAQYREAVKAGDPRVLPRRDQGPARALARDYVDTHRMASNYLLGLFVLFLLGYLVPAFEYVAIVVFVFVLGEWYLTGKRIRKIAADRSIETKETPIGLGFYAGSRAYMPRSWRRPAPRLKLGDKI